MSDDQPREVVGIENERGEIRQYETVASRLARFRKAYPDHALLTEVIKDDGDSVAVKATIGWYVGDAKFLALANGHSEEFRLSSEINRTACIENAETSAWGRALAAFGYVSGTGVASADEIQKAKAAGAAQKEQAEREPGTLILLQNAAKKGEAALSDTWLNELTKADRQACKNYMPKLKKQAQEADKKRAQPDEGDGDNRG